VKKKLNKKKFKEKMNAQRFKDQLEDAWYLIRKRKRLKRKQLFNTFTSDKKET
jgi:hypothetical protein|tara:strand:- start:4360 stop:4518 length:159 start_codon:yes stop_codon:yes gene_type:complete